MYAINLKNKRSQINEINNDWLITKFACFWLLSSCVFGGVHISDRPEGT